MIVSLLLRSLDGQHPGPWREVVVKTIGSGSTAVGCLLLSHKRSHPPVSPGLGPFTPSTGWQHHGLFRLL